MHARGHGQPTAVKEQRRRQIITTSTALRRNAVEVCHCLKCHAAGGYGEKGKARGGALTAFDGTVKQRQSHVSHMKARYTIMDKH